MLPRWCTDQVTVLRAPTVRERGSEVRDWANAEAHAVAGCSVQPSNTGSDMDAREGQVTDRWRLYAPPGADVQAGDRIQWGGHTFEVDGAPYQWTSPTGRVSHKQAMLVEWSG